MELDPQQQHAPPPPPQTDGLPPDMALADPEMMGAPGGNPYYPDDPDLSGGLPINLDSLRDGPPGSKPFYPYSTLIRYAIKGSPTGKLLLEDIYYAIESRFPYFRSAPAGWKNSVRHNLSLNPCFVKVPRPLTDRGKGSYWTVDDNVDPRTGVHRIRKKKVKKPKEEFPGGGGVGVGVAGPAGPTTPEQGVPDGGAPPAVQQQPPQQPQSAEYPNAQYPPPEPPRAPQEYDEQQNVQFVQQMPDGSDGRVATPNPAAFSAAYSYDPSYQMLRYPPIPLFTAEDQLPVNERGEVDWRMTWLKELNMLQSTTEQQDKANVNEAWYREMFFRIRHAIVSPIPFDPAQMMAMMSGAPPPQPLQHMEQHPERQGEQIQVHV